MCMPDSRSYRDDCHPCKTLEPVKVQNRRKHAGYDAVKEVASLGREAGHVLKKLRVYKKAVWGV